MELTQAQLKSLQTLTVNTNKVKTDNIVVGQELQAKVTAVDTQKAEITLKINDAVVTAKLNAAKALLQLSAGQTLQVTVTQTSENKIVLQLPAALLESAAQQKVLRDTLLAALPKQQPITDAIIQLKALINPAAGRQLPASIIDFAKNFVAKLPTPEQLSTAEGVKQAIKQSGIFLENKFSQLLSTGTKTNVDGDLKSLLLGLKSTLVKESSTTGQMLNQQSVQQSSSTKIDSAQMLTPSAKPTLTTPLPTTVLKTDAAIASAITSLPNQIKANTTLPPQSPNIASAQNNSAAQAQNQAITSSSTTSTAANIEKNQYIKIMEIRSLEESIALALKNTGNTSNVINTDKMLSDKQIQQILSNLLGQKKSSLTSFRSPQTGLLAPPPALALSPSQSTTGARPLQQYTGKETAIQNNELAMTAIKSQNVNEVSTPRINNIVDLIETLIKQVDSAISRTQIHQVNALQDQESGKLALSLEIPVNDDDDLHLIKLDIEKEKSKKDETETIVTVNLAIDLNAIGPVYAKITLVNDKTSIVLWAERDTTFELVQESIDVLQLKLTSSGLTPDGIACHHGQPPQSRFVKTQINNGLVDERA